MTTNLTFTVLIGLANTTRQDWTKTVIQFLDVRERIEKIED
jgi:hypothetical protein